MKNLKVRAFLLLLLASAIWGFAFVAQKIAMRYMGPFLFNSVRFMLGAAVLLPFIVIGELKERRNGVKKELKPYGEKVLFSGIIAGGLIFIAASLQQFGVVYTTAGKAGFITGLYIVFVPIIGVIFKQKIKGNVWISVFLAVLGLYLLSIKSGLRIEKGDFLVLISALFWAFHVQFIGHFAKRVEALKLASLQFFTNSILSFLGALFFESISLESLSKGIWAILYAGVLSVGVAYTLQIYGQKHISPSVSAIILSIESVFSVIGGFIILGEILSFKEISGCFLMFFSMILAQFDFSERLKSKVKH